MLEPIASFFAHPTVRVDSVVQLGAGQGDWLSLVSHLDFQSYTVLDPRKDVTDLLQERFLGDDRISILNRAITNSKNPQCFRSVDGKLVTVSQPTEICSLYPSARFESLDEATFLSIHDLTLSNNSLVICDSLGSDTLIADYLLEHREGHVKYVVTQLTDRVLVDGGRAAADQIQALESAGYDLVFETNGHSQLFRTFVFYFDEQKNESKELSFALGKVTHENKELEKKLAEERERVSELESRLDAEVSRSRAMAAQNASLFTSSLKVGSRSQDEDRDGIGTTSIRDLVVGAKPELDILVAGIRHSGSTALFNIVRLVLEKSDIDFQSGYVEHDWFKQDSPQGIRLIKIHEPKYDITQRPTVVLTTVRDLRNTVASASRRGFPLLEAMGPVHYSEYNRMIEEFWRTKSDFLFVYEEYVSDPIKFSEALCEFLGFHDINCQELIANIDNLPNDDYEVTLLSDHITDPERKLTFHDTLKEGTVEAITKKHKDWLDLFRYQ